jgi:hypothetical protein
VRDLPFDMILFSVGHALHSSTFAPRPSRLASCAALTHVFFVRTTPFYRFADLSYFFAQMMLSTMRDKMDRQSILRIMFARGE